MNVHPSEIRFINETIAVLCEQRRMIQQTLDAMDQRFDEMTRLVDDIEFGNYFTKIGLNDTDDDASYRMD
jgi:hypothetical protein